jgi:hypothetical protein
MPAAPKAEKSFRLLGFRLQGGPWAQGKDRPGPGARRASPGACRGKCNINLAPEKRIPPPLLARSAVPCDTLRPLPGRPGRRSLRGRGANKKSCGAYKMLHPYRGNAPCVRGRPSWNRRFSLPLFPAEEEADQGGLQGGGGSAGLGFPFSGTKIAFRGAGGCPPKGPFYAEPSERAKDWKEMG